MKVVHLMMPASKFAEAVEFYVEGLGLKSDTAEAGSIMFVVGRQKIKLVPVPGPLLQRHTNLSLHVHGLHECIRHLVSTGRVPRSDLARCANAYGRFDVSDPGGNIISLVEAG
jgi:catechol 2,3-dioxygenase-like lactoylglutathione lyase family enzyme